jgi:cytochrome c oxidase assembly protein Cox11
MYSVRPACAASCKQQEPNALSMQGALVVGMLGLAYASVPLYRMFCQVSELHASCHLAPRLTPTTNHQATGYAGTVRTAKVRSTLTGRFDFAASSQLCRCV